MAVIYPHFLHTILRVHESIRDQIPYPFFDNACIRYEALRSARVEGASIQTVIEKYGLTDYAYRQSVSAFQQHGTAGLIGIDSQQLTEDLPIEVERMVFVLKKAKPCHSCDIFMLPTAGHWEPNPMSTLIFTP